MTPAVFHIGSGMIAFKRRRMMKTLIVMLSMGFLIIMAADQLWLTGFTV